ncbi:hypothetical protein Mterra_03757 [Calidithermus terrae]|uniref:NAD-specific glutamate dehydrogenase n=1 Tax=Calidithermus terrae TaxID=1408545 RepID=A0A399E1D7_9DEIN|nr:hypothetical protein Mterra_03757 [Calidithermus terrae]
MLLPEVVHDLQDHEALDRAGELGRELGLALGVLGQGGFDQLFHALVGLERAQRLVVVGLEARREVGHGALEGGEVPLLGVDLGVEVELSGRSHAVFDHGLGGLAHLLVLAQEDGAALGVDHLALAGHHVVELQQLLADAEVAVLNALLGPLDGGGDHVVDDGLAVVEAHAVEHGDDAVGGEQAHEVVVEGYVEARGAGVALAARTPAQLVVDAARLVALGADDVQAPELLDPDLVGGAGVAQAADLLHDLGAHAELGAQAAGLFLLALHGLLDEQLDLPLVAVEALLLQQGRRQVLGVAAELDVGAAPGHVGRDGHGLAAPGLGHDLRLALVVLGVQDLVRDALADELERVHRALEQVPGGAEVALGGDGGVVGLEVGLLDLRRAGQQAPDLLPLPAALLLGGLEEDLGTELDLREVVARLLEHGRKPLGLLDRDGAHQHRLALLVLLGDLLDHGEELAPLGAVDHVGAVLADDLSVGRDGAHVHPVDLLELLLLGLGGAGHARDLLVEAEEVLVGDGGEGLVLALDLDALFGLDGLVQALAVAAPGHQAAGELVNDDHLAVLHDVVAVDVVEVLGPERLGEHVGLLHVLGVEQALHAQQLLGLGDALHGEVHRLLLLVDGVVAGGLLAHAGLGLLAALELLGDLGHAVVHVGGLLGRPADDERGAGLVDEDGIDLVNDGVVQRGVVAQHQEFGLHHHVVAQVVEAQLRVGHVGHVGAVGGLALLGGGVVLDDAHAQAQAAVHGPHPLGVAAGEVVVDGHQVHALARDGVERDRERRHQRLALAGAHLRDLALVQRRPADELHVVVAQPQETAARLAGEREGRGQQVVEGLAVLIALAQLGIGRGQVLDLLHLGLEGVDRGDHGLPVTSDVPLVVVKELIDEAQHNRSRF